jgi:hypothetical protein
MIGYHLDILFEEVAYVAYYLHWPHDQIMRMEHRERRSWVKEVAKINQQLNDAGMARSGDPWQ